MAVGRSRHCLTGQTLCNTLDDTLPDVQAKTLFDTVAFTVAEVKARILVNILSDVEAKILFDTIADTVAELEVETPETHREMWKAKQWSRSRITR